MKLKFLERRIENSSIIIAALLMLSGCVSTPIQPPIVGFTCCNLRPHSGWVSSNNVQGGAILPAGEPIRMDSIKKSYYVYGSIGATNVGLRDDSAKNEADTLRWVRSIIVTNNPRVQLSAWPTEIRTAVQYGMVVIGMTRAQVLMSLGYPSLNDTPDIGSFTWRYWTSREDLPVDLHFDENGQLIKFTGKQTAIRTISAEL